MSVEEQMQREAELHQRAVACIVTACGGLRRNSNVSDYAFARAIVARLAALEPPILIADPDDLK